MLYCDQPNLSGNDGFHFNDYLTVLYTIIATVQITELDGKQKGGINCLSVIVLHLLRTPRPLSINEKKLQKIAEFIKSLIVYGVLLKEFLFFFSQSR